MPCVKTCINILPIVLILLLLAWSYYTYVVVLCIFTIESIVKRILYLATYHFLFVMALMCYFMAMCTQNEMVPEYYRLPIYEYELLRLSETEDEKNQVLEQYCKSKGINVCTTTNTGGIRYCKRCKQIKPDRAHHCSNCKRCILKMDHHCPWLNNCVGFSNYKAFVMVLFYGTIYCLFIFATTLEHFIYFFTRDMTNVNNQQLAFLFVAAFCLGSVVGALLVFHTLLLVKNQTTLESLREPVFRVSEWSFDLGCYDNFTEVMGDYWFCWFCPMDNTENDGLEFPVSSADEV